MEGRDLSIKRLRNNALLVYILYMAGLFVGFIPIVAGVIVAYIKKEDAKGTYIESHFNYQIKTFWIILAVGILGILTIPIFIGFVILFAVFVYYMYRVVKGIVYLNDEKSV